MKRLLYSMLLAAGAAVPAAAQNPSYTINGRDTTCQIFVYSPGPSDGLHVAYYDDTDKWVDMGNVVSSDYGPWGREKKMFHPFVAQAHDGTWRALWQVNDHAPAFAVAWSDDLINWRPQDYPQIREKGASAPVAYQRDDNTWDVYVKTSQGKRYVHASDDFRVFTEDTIPSDADDVLWEMGHETVDGKEYEGNVFQVPALQVSYIFNWMKAVAAENAADAEASKMAPKADAPVEARLDIDYSQVKDISDKLCGIFFEDISYAADGGLWAEMVQNGDFEYNGEDRKHTFGPATAWKQIAGNPKYLAYNKMNLSKQIVRTDKPLSKNNAHYVVISNTSIYNEGWDGFHFTPGADYTFSFWERNLDTDEKQFRISLFNKQGKEVAGEKIVSISKDWKKYDVTLSLKKIKPENKKELDDVKLVITPLKDGSAAIDMVSLMPSETFMGHGLRKDLADTIAALKPRFVRFPGGCATHGDGTDNIYNWKESIGAPQNRTARPNIWRYHQSRRLGFYEFFQWCEDMGAEPLPVLAAGVPCQNSGENAAGVAGQQGGIPMKDMPQYVQDVLDLIEYANGDPTKNKWARERAKAGHPQPFNLKMIGIGNEDLISTDFEKRYLMIAKAVKERYPDMKIVGTAGPFHYPSSDYIEGWRVAKDAKTQSGSYLFHSIDEHYYEQPGWFINHQDYYDNYDRKAPKVYLGEYASRGRDAVANALAEGIYMCSLERNGDVVEMTSYAPLLAKDGHSNWSPDLIYFNNDTVRTTPSYEVQKLFSTHSGDKYIASVISLPDESMRKWVGTSVVRDTHNNITWVKVVNALPQPLKLKVGNKVFYVPARGWKAFSL